MQVYSYVFTIVKNQSLAEEITQNTFYKAMTAKRPYEGKAGELTWLCSIAKNLAIDECRKNKKFSELDETLPQDRKSTRLIWRIKFRIQILLCRFIWFFMNYRSRIKRYFS